MGQCIALWSMIGCSPGWFSKSKKKSNTKRLRGPGFIGFVHFSCLASLWLPELDLARKGDCHQLELLSRVMGRRHFFRPQEIMGEVINHGGGGAT